MKVYNLQYINNGTEGLATVEALNPNSATKILQTYGRLNSYRYKVTSIKEVGCNDSPIERIVEEVFSSECNSQPAKFDINSLTKEDIKELKLRINEYTGTLYVDRIGEGFRKNAEDGHTVLWLSGKGGRKHVIPDDIVVDVVRTEGLYVKKNGVYIFLGYPTKYKFIESGKEKIQVHYNIKRNNVTSTYETVEVFHRRRLALFQRANARGKGALSHIESKKKPARWQFIRFYDGPISERSIMHFIKYTYRNKQHKIASRMDSNNHRIDVYKYAIGEISKPIAGPKGKTAIEYYKYPAQPNYHLKGAPLFETSYIVKK